MAEQAAPPFLTNRSSDIARAFTTTQVNLRAISGCPQFGPQRCVVYGTGAAGVGSVTFTMDDGTALVVPIAGLVVIPVDVPVRAIAAITTAVVLAHWYSTPAKHDAQLGPFLRNP